MSSYTICKIASGKEIVFKRGLIEKTDSYFAGLKESYYSEGFNKLNQLWTELKYKKGVSQKIKNHFGSHINIDFKDINVQLKKQNVYFITPVRQKKIIETIVRVRCYHKKNSQRKKWMCIAANLLWTLTKIVLILKVKNLITFSRFFITFH